MGEAITGGKELRMFVGIDVSKEHLDVALRPAAEAWQVANDAAGIADVCARLTQSAPALIVLEATGGYESAVVAALGAAGLPVVVVNPRQVRDASEGSG
jgi:transposase